MVLFLFSFFLQHTQTGTHFRHTNLMRELNYIAKRSGMEPKVKYNDDASGHSIGYISLAGHTFPDPRALEQMLQGMFQRSKELDVCFKK